MHAFDAICTPQDTVAPKKPTIVMAYPINSAVFACVAITALMC